MTNPHADLPKELDFCKSVSLAKGTKIFEVGDKCRQFVYVVSGNIRVDLASESGSSLLLYRLNATNTCVLTTSCLMSGDQYCAEATVEEDTSLLIMPADQFFISIEQSARFRSFVFSSFSQRLTALMAKVDEIAFRSIERRLAGSLLHHAKGGNKAAVTHEQLASEIGTAREVVSRKLSQWHAAEIVTKGRGEIQLLTIEYLKSVANDTH
ncbi:MAG: Crp/Fnr family transcriptional regulator [Granulosicoccaceae bacterium]